MKVFVAGATGVLGRPAVARFLAAGAEVTGVARSPQKQAELHDLGAVPVQVSLFDRDALIAAVAGHDVVCNLATAIPTGERAGVLAAWEDNHRIRREGSRNLVDAALEAGAGHYVQESIALLYADGGECLLDEQAPVEPTWITASALDAEAEATRFARHGGVGIALRFGFFCGPDSAHTVEMIAAARRGTVPVPGPAAAYRSSVTTDDAGSAVVAALDAPSGIYNVADDRPLRRSEYVDALTQALGAEPLAVPSEAPDLPAEAAMLAWSQRVSNRRFAEATSWRPRFPSAWEAWPAIVAEVREPGLAERR